MAPPCGRTPPKWFTASTFIVRVVSNAASANPSSSTVVPSACVPDGMPFQECSTALETFSIPASLNAFSGMRISPLS